MVVMKSSKKDYAGRKLLQINTTNNTKKKKEKLFIILDFIPIKILKKL